MATGRPLNTSPRNLQQKYGSLPSMEESKPDLQQEIKTRWIDREELVRGLLFGIINGTICLPASISFATIIFKHEAFAPYLPGLVRLVLFSSAAHALVFVCFSSMPFAVGQVQDAGLIFLSAMASTIADYCHAHDLDDNIMLSTVLVMLSFSTALLGIALIIIGRLKLASIVQYLPMAAIGGYLAFIGLFCCQAGLSFMTQLAVDSIPQWWKFVSPDALIKLAPGLLLGLGIFYLCRRIRHVLVLPGCLAASIATFYVILYGMQYDIRDARRYGWIAEPMPPSPFWQSWEAFDFRIVRWEVIPLILPTWFALVVVVAFSSSLDVAAIEMEVKKPLDYDYELRMIGLSNVVSGVTGGFTGSYIFSQTIFTLRSGVKSRLCSAIIALCELAVFVSPVSIIAYIPRFFFGGLLILIATDLMLEWLWVSRKKMMWPEYLVTLATFLAIQATNIEAGMGIGILFSIVAFTFSYAEAPTVVHSRIRHSTVIRTFEERTILNANMDKMVTVSLRGYIFFGSAVKILREIKENVLKQHQTPSPSAASPAAAMDQQGSVNIHPSPFISSSPLASPPQPIIRNKSSPRMVPSSLLLDGRETSATTSRSTSIHNNNIVVRRRRSHSLADSDGGSRMTGSSVGGGGGGGGIRGARIASSLMTPVYNRGGFDRGVDLDYGVDGGGEGGVGVVNGEAQRMLAVDLESEEDKDDEEAVLFTTTNHDDDNEWEIEGGSGAVAIGGDASSPFDLMSSGPASFETANGGYISGYASSRGTYLSPQSRLNSPEREASSIAAESVGEASRAAALGGGGSSLSTHGLIDWYLANWAAVPGAKGETEAQKASSPLLYHPEGGGSVLHLGGEGGGKDGSINRIRWLIFDFSAVTGLDATAARSCFLMLKSLLRSAGITLIFAALSSRVATLLRAHGVVCDGDRVFETLDEALEYCEEMLLRHAGEMSHADLHALSRHPSYYAAVQRSRRMTKWALLDPTGSRRDRPMSAHEALDLQSILADYLEVGIVEGGPEQPALASQAGAQILLYYNYFEELEVYSGQCLFRAGEASDRLYFIRAGVVELQVTDKMKGDPIKPIRLTKISDGGSFGELGFFLRRPQKFTAIAKTRCLLYALSREALLSMFKTHPQLASILQMAVLKSICLSASYTIRELNGCH